MSARAISRSSGAAPWLVLTCALALTAIGVAWRAQAVSTATEVAVASAESHFDDVVDDFERRIDDAQRELSLVLVGAGLVGIEARGVSDVADRLDRLGTSSLGGLLGFALVPSDALPLVVAGVGSGLDDDTLSSLSGMVAPDPRRQATWVAPLNADEDAPIVAGLTLDGGQLVAVFDGDIFLLGVPPEGAHHVMARLRSLPGSGQEPRTVDRTNDMDDMAGMDDDASMSADPRFSSSSDVDVFGESWTLHVDAMAGFLRTPSSQEVTVVAALGALLSLILFVFTSRLIRSIRVELEKFEAQDELRATGERFAAGFDRSLIGVAEVDDVGIIVKVNGALASLLDRSQSELVGLSMSTLVCDRDEAESRRRLRNVSRGAETDARAEVCYKVDGRNSVWVQETASAIPGPTGSGHVLVQIVDFSDERRARDELQHQALHDGLTGLPNRSFMDAQIAQALHRGRGKETLTAVMFIDVDRFKQVNDTLGHGSGDRLLRHLADRLVASARETDTVARFGGDEFVVLCEDLTSEAEAFDIAERVRTVFEESIGRGSDTPMPITVSIGIALGVEGDDSEAMIRDADLAMYEAKAAGRDRVVLFEREMRESLLDRVALEAQLRQAIDGGELRLRYQPLYDLEQEAVVGFEALVRWQHPTRGLLVPAEFLSAAEQAGVLSEIDEWVLATAVAQLAAWKIASPAADDWTIAVNASPVNFGDGAYPALVAKTLARADISADLFTIEITEEAVLCNAETASQVIADLREIGVRLAIDDFGTGYSSFSQLATLDVDVLKIDRSFVAAIHEDSGSAIVRAVIEMARALGLTTIAEGAESIEDVDGLRVLGADVVQGYAVARPMAADAVLGAIDATQRYGFCA